ncbi:MAG: alpha/beta fold hydrolase [Solirubrobacterales bacterium]
MRVAVTGAAGDFGTAILRVLVADERVDELIAIDLTEPRLTDSKLRAEICDVRSARMRELFAGCESVIHLAFVLIPRRDLQDARSVNLDGTRNVVEAAAAAEAKRLVVASSLSAHGVPEPGQPPVTEATPPGSASGHFYFDDKAAVERMLDAWEGDHPEEPLVITRLRPGFVHGPDFSNPALAMMGSRLAVVPDDGGRTQLIHQDDVARAFAAATFADSPGPYLIVTEDSVSLEELGELSEGRVVRVPRRAARLALDGAHALRLSPISGDWAVSGDRVGRLGRARDELGWEPSLTSRESALVLLAQHGRELRYVDGPPRPEVAERMLEVPTGLILDARERNPALAELDLELELERLEHDWVDHRGRLIHLEVHEVEPGAPAFVIPHGLGDHSRRHLGLAGALAERGWSSLLIDREGHGLSEGRRGDATLESDLALVELAIGLARARFGGPVILLGDSLGGIMSWYLLTREPDVDAVVCHCISHPDVNHDPAFLVKAPLMRALGRVAPHAPISVRQIADYDHVALDPVTKRCFDDETDKLFNFSVTARAAASYIGFQPGIPWQSVRTPVLAVIGGEDRMVPPRFTRECFDRATPPGAEYLEIEDAGHQLFLDDLGLAIGPLSAWVGAQLAARPRAASP